MKIIVTDGYVENPGDLSWAPLEALGEVTYYDRIGLTDEDETIRPDRRRGDRRHQQDPRHPRRSWTAVPT